MNDNDEYKDLKQYPSAYDQRLIGDHAARLLSRTIKALKFNRRQKATEGVRTCASPLLGTIFTLGRSDYPCYCFVGISIQISLDMES